MHAAADNSTTIISTLVTAGVGHQHRLNASSPSSHRGHDAVVVPHKLLNSFSVMNIVICAPLLALQLMTLPIFVIYPNYRKSVCFRILFTNGVTDCLQLAPMLIFAVLNLMITDHIPIWAQMIAGSIVINAWNLLVVQHLLLAINRLIVIMRAKFLGSPYVLGEEMEAKLFNAAHLLCWSFFLVIIALHQTDLMGDLFHRSDSQFIFDIQKPYTQSLRDVFWWVTVVMPIICLIIYILIIVMAKMSRANTQRVVHGKTNGQLPRAPLLNTHERRLLIQAIILYLGMGLLIIAWNSFSKCNDEMCEGKILKLIPVSLSRTMHVYLIEGPWMIYCGLNPILFLTMNSDFRRRFLKILCNF